MTELVLDIWHPDCWTLTLTESESAGLVGYGASPIPGSESRVGYYTVYGNTRDHVDDFLRSMRSCPLIDRVVEHRFGPAIAPVTTDIVVETGTAGGMREAFRSRGFLHLGPTWHRDGRERRMLVTEMARSQIRAALTELEHEFEADIEVTRIGRLDGAPLEPDGQSGNGLSIRQREAFLLARERGYYHYPRATSAAELAAELDIARSTFLEHLHKAERKLLSNISV